MKPKVVWQKAASCGDQMRMVRGVLRDEKLVFEFLDGIDSMDVERWKQIADTPFEYALDAAVAISWIKEAFNQAVEHASSSKDHKAPCPSCGSSWELGIEKALERIIHHSYYPEHK